jgi:hypothetical protein
MSTLVVIGDNDRYPAGEAHLYKTLLHLGSMEVIGC